MADQVTENLGQFYEYQWGKEEGQVYIATLEKGGDFKQYMLEWPLLKNKIVRFTIEQSATGKDVYYCPALFVPEAETVERNPRTGKTLATKANIKGAQTFWVDFDNGLAPDNWKDFAASKGIPEPTLVIQSSVKGNQHVYWRTEFTNAIEDIEHTNRSLAISVGADRSGWDGNQLLRPPYTANFGFKSGGEGEHKPWFKGEPVPVGIIGNVSPARIPSQEFANLGNIERELLNNLRLSGNLPSLEQVKVMATWTEDLFKQFSMSQDEATESSPHKRSGALQVLAYLGAEAGFTDEQIYVILDDADRRWDKYVRRSPASREKILKDTIVRARTKIGYLNAEDLTFAGLISTSEVQVTEVPKVAYSLEEFMAAEIKLDWLVEDLLAVGGIGLLTGQPNAGKTQFGLQLAMGLALGSKHILGWNAKGPVKVFMLSLEMAHAPLKKFMSNVVQAYPEHLREISKNLTISPLGKDLPLNAQTGEGSKLVNNLLSEYRPDILFIDSLQKISNKPLTDEVAVKELLSNLETIRQKFGCSIYAIHHDRKRMQGNESSAGSLSDMYGNQYLSANVDFVLSIRKTATKGELLVDTWKNRLAEERNTFRIKRNQYLQYDLMTELEDGDENLRILGRSPRLDTDPDEGGKTLSI